MSDEHVSAEEKHANYLAAIQAADAEACPHCRVLAYCAYAHQLGLAVLYSTQPPSVELYQHGEPLNKVEGKLAEIWFANIQNEMFESNTMQESLLAVYTKLALLHATGTTSENGVLHF